MANSSPTSDAITRTVRASLKLATTSTEQLSLTQLLTLSVELQKASATVNAKIQSRLDATPGRPKVTIKMNSSDDDSSSEIGEDEGTHAASTATSGESGTAPPDIPNPYPISSPDLNELPDYWYIVTHGTEVGIFSDSASANCAVAGVVGGNQIKVKSWYEAATLYNKLYRQGNIIRVVA